MFFRKKATHASGNSSSNQVAQNLNRDDSEAPPLSRDVELVMHDLSLNGWDIMASEDFNAVTLALDLLDSSSHSKPLTGFFTMLERLEQAMDSVVNEHYQAFNNSIETFGRVVDSIGDSQRKVRTLKQELVRCKQLLQCKRPDLLELWVRSVQYREMMRLLDVVEDLRRAPDRIQSLIHAKHYLNAVTVLLATIKTATSSDFCDIGALNDVRTTLHAIKDSLHETILEDLYFLDARC
jgi:exocyst complex component 4